MRVYLSGAEHFAAKRVASGHKDQAMMGELGHGCERGRLDTAALGANAGEKASGLANKGARLPQLPGGVEECLHLRSHHAKARGEAKQKPVVVLRTLVHE